MPVSGGTSASHAAGVDTGSKSQRVFVALKIAANIAQELTILSAEIAGPTIRRVAVADLHLTLVPPWRETSIPDAIGKLTRLCVAHRQFDLIFHHVGYGPEPRRPRFLWADCSAGSELTELRAALLAAFGQADDRPFRPHVTLARIRSNNGAAIARRHPLDRALAHSQRIVSVDLMRSPPVGGTGYTVLASVPLAAAPPVEKRAEQAGAKG